VPEMTHYVAGGTLNLLAHVNAAHYTAKYNSSRSNYVNSDE